MFREEPATENPLFAFRNVVCTPHLGASTMEAQENVALQVAEQMSDYLLRGAISNAVNFPSISAEEAPKLKPFIALAEKLGSFAGQLTETGIKQVQIAYEGGVAQMNTKALTSAALAGLLRPMLQDVNVVSAPIVAKERGIVVEETRREAEGDYDSLITVTVVTDRQTRAVVGHGLCRRPSAHRQHQGHPHGRRIRRRRCSTSPTRTSRASSADSPRCWPAPASISRPSISAASPLGGNAIALVEVDGAVPPEVLAKVQQIRTCSRSSRWCFKLRVCYFAS